MPYFFINTASKVIIDSPEFQKNLDDITILKKVISQFNTEESDFLKKLSGQGCQPIVLNALATSINASIDEKKYLEKFYKNLTLTTYNFSKILVLINYKKSDEEFITRIYSKLNIANLYTPIKAKVFVEFLQCFIQDFLTQEPLLPLFSNITDVEAFIETLKITIEKISNPEKFILSDWLTHLNNIQNSLIFTKVIIDMDASVLNTPTIQKINQELTQSNTHDRHHLYLALVILEFQKTLEIRFGFEPAMEKWEIAKQKKIDGLITLIKEHGYLPVGGYFGKSFHNNEEPKPKNEPNFCYYFWPKNSFRIDLQKRQVGHNVIVVGAQKANSENSQDLVFFLDPTADKYNGVYRIFAISYNSFCQRLSCENPLLKIFPITQHTILLHPKLKPTVKPTLRDQVVSFWQSSNCKTVTKAVAIGLSIAATALSYTLSR